MLDALGLAGGFGLLVVGGTLLVRSASALAGSFGVPPVLIGLTVVAFGTSAPELAVNITASAAHTGGIAFGNVVGSNLVNLGLILGLCGVLRPLVIESRIVARELPMMLLATVVVLVLGLDPQLGSGPGGYPRAEGLVLLLLFCVFLYAAAGELLRRRPDEPVLAQAEAAVPAGPTQRRALHAVLSLTGLGALFAGGELTVSSGSALARAAGLSDAVIGLTVVAVGTSLPELVTSIVATVRGQVDIAIGNVVGSNIFNLLFIFGISTTVSPVAVPEGGLTDLVILTGLSVLVTLLAVTHARRIVRWEGAVLLAAWIGYTAWRVVGAG